LHESDNKLKQGRFPFNVRNSPQEFSIRQTRHEKKSATEELASSN